MKYKIIYKDNGFSHVILLCAISVCALIGVAGYRVVSNAPNKSTTVTTAESLTRTDPQNSQSVNVDTPPALPAPTPEPPPQSSPAPAPAPSPTPNPAPNFSTVVQIKGDATCQTNTLDALKLLNDNAPSHYSTTTSNIGIIECTAQGSGMYAYQNPPLYKVGDATRGAGTVWYAGTIAHDAGHSKLYHDYLSSHPGQPVPDDVWTGEAAERSCLEAQYDALTKIEGSQAQLDYIKDVINSQYYNVPYDQRWW